MNIGFQDSNLARDRIRQEPVLATLRLSRLSRLCDRQTRIRQFRERAEELRGICEDVILQDTKLMLQRLAETYDRMALSLETALPNA